MDGYLLGIIWGSASVHHQNLIIKNKDRFYVDYAVTALGGHTRIQYSRTGLQYTANLPLRFDMLQKYNWAMRNDNIRPYPTNMDDDVGFISAWVELHHALDFCTIRGAKHPRLRIYGNCELMQTINQKISEIAKVKIKTLQFLSNNKTVTLYYQSYDEIVNIHKTFFRHINIDNGR